MTTNTCFGKKSTLARALAHYAQDRGLFRPSRRSLQSGRLYALHADSTTRVGSLADQLSRRGRHKAKERDRLRRQWVYMLMRGRCVLKKFSS